jgi:hypothetical protein
VVKIKKITHFYSYNGSLSCPSSKSMKAGADLGGGAAGAAAPVAPHNTY